MAIRNNIIYTFSNLPVDDIGIYKEKKSRVIKPCEEINFASDNSKLIARNIFNWLKQNDLCNIYDFGTKIGILNSLTIRENTNNESMIIFYVNKQDGMNNFLCNLANFPFENLKIKSVFVQYYITVKGNLRNSFDKIYGNDYLEYNLLGNKILISPGSFYQTNNIVLEKMYNDIQQYLIKDKQYIFLDLYCGVGIMSLLVGSMYKESLGVEINPNAIDMANLNKQTNNNKDLKFICSSVEDIIDRLVDKNNEFVIFINPPRRGIYENVIDKLNEIKPYIKQIIYLSCSELTLKRDLEQFDFESKVLNKYMMFPDNLHVETCVELLKKQ